MRTTLILDDDVVRQAKHRAADLGMTLSALVNRALREVLRSGPPAEEPPFEMLTYGSGRHGRGLEPREVDDLLRAQEAGGLRREG